MIRARPLTPPLPLTSHPTRPGGAEAALAAEFERLFAQYQAPILNYLYRLLGDPGVAEDLTQEAFARAWKARRDLPGLENPRAWLYRVATNLARDHVRRARLLHWLPLFGHEPADEADSGDPLEARRMQRALLKLNADYRVPLVLYTCQDFSVVEIAATLAISTDAVKQRLVRARQQLRDAYESVTA